MSDFGTLTYGQKGQSVAWMNYLIDHGLEKAAASFIVRQNGSNYQAIYGKGSNQAGKIYDTYDEITDLFTDVADTGGELDGTGGIIFVQGYGPDSPYLVTEHASYPGYGITVKANGTIIIGEGHNIANTHGCTVFKQADNENLTYPFMINAVNVHCRDFLFHGNKGNNATSGDGITVSGADDGELINVGAYYAKKNGFNVAGSSCIFRSCFSEYNDDGGFKVSENDTFFFDACWSALNEKYGWYLVGDVKEDTFIGCRSQEDKEEGWVLQSYGGTVNLNQFLGCVVESTNDSYEGERGFELLGAQRNLFANCVLYNFARETTNTYDGFYLASQSTTHSIRNILRDCLVISDVAKVHKYGVYEADANQDYNQYINVNSEGHGTGAIYIQGPNSTVKNCLSYNPVGKGTNPFDTTNDRIVINGGAAASPAASTDYTVCHADIIISSTDSGNTDNAILIKDGGGNQINPSALSTLDAYYVPVGYKINWGAFTGAAPTVVVAFI